MTQQWKPIASAPKDGTAIIVMQNNWPGCPGGVAEACNGHNTYVAEWWSGEGDGGAWMCYMDQIREPRCPITPTHWMPLPDAPCQTCNDQGAVGNILTAQPRPDCPPPASAQDDAKDERTRVMEIIAGVWDRATQIDDAADEVIDLLRAPAAGDARLPTLNIEAAAKAMAECMDYPWAHMPEQGRATMREHAQTVIRAASQQQEG